jgi:hypothetical protein
MHAATVRTVLEEARDMKARVAVGFADRSLFIDHIQGIETRQLGGDAILVEVAGMVYDTGHSRQATPERIWFESTAVVSLAIPVSHE